jgi:hypothetical protein
LSKLREEIICELFRVLSLAAYAGEPNAEPSAVEREKLQLRPWGGAAFFWSYAFPSAASSRNKILAISAADDPTMRPAQTYIRPALHKARRIVANIAKLPELLTSQRANKEGRIAAALSYSLWLFVQVTAWAFRFLR